MKTITNKFKIALAAVGLLAMGTMSAQTAPTDSGTANTTQANSAGPTIRLIDNKGTIKYMQSNNGITTITSTANGNRTTTTWQLGGTLVENTTITMPDADTNGTSDIDFTIDGDTFKLQNIDENSDVAATTTTPTGGTGYTILVRDEATGTIQKRLATSLIESGQTYFTASVADETTGPTTAELDFDVAAATAPAPSMTGNKIPLPTYEKVWVYRNGAKLIANVDYTVSGSVVTLVPNTSAPNDWTLYNGDIIEVQYVK